MIIRQAEAALWLLTRFGGTGSKSRKGFGSFEDITVKGVESLEDCIARGKELRDACGLITQTGNGTGTPALEKRIGAIEVQTRWTDPWFVLDRIGDVYQRAIKEIKFEDRDIFGLPRKKGFVRLASPVHWSIAHGAGQNLKARLIILPGSPPEEANRDTLEKFSQSVEKELRNEARNRKQTSRTLQTSQRAASDNTSSLTKWADIKAELLDEKTRKGGWKAKDLKTGVKGYIENTGDVPTDARVGQQVKLIVKVPDSNRAAFYWPTPEKEKMRRSAKNGPKSGARHIPIECWCSRLALEILTSWKTRFFALWRKALKVANGAKSFFCLPLKPRATL